MIFNEFKTIPPYFEDSGLTYAEHDCVRFYVPDDYKIVMDEDPDKVVEFIQHESGSEVYSVLMTNDDVEHVRVDEDLPLRVSEIMYLETI